MIKNIAEYVDINPNTDLLKTLYEFCEVDFNAFGKTKWHSFALEHVKGGDTKFLELFEPILSIHRAVHPDIQKRSTGFNLSTSTEHDLYAHTDLDYNQEHPNYYNLVVPVYGESTIEYFETNEDEIQIGIKNGKPDLNCHGEVYYHEFKNRTHKGYEDFLQKRKFAECKIDKPLLIDTNTMHRVIVQKAPRVAWVTRWRNIPEEVDFQTFKRDVESIL